MRYAPSEASTTITVEERPTPPEKPPEEKPPMRREVPIALGITATITAILLLSTNVREKLVGFFKKIFKK